MARTGLDLVFPPMPDISVLLATHNRASFVEKCLVSLCEQNLDPQRYEICVIANACTDDTPEIVDKIAARYPRRRVFMVEEPMAGLSRARNCGLRHTSTPLVANVDDDATVDPDWLERFLARFAELGPDIAIVGGEVSPVWGAPRPAWLTDAMLPLLAASSGFGTEPRFTNEGLLEGNGCYRREALEEAGLFPTTLGRKGNSLLSAEHAVALVMNMRGWKLYFDPSIIIHHTIHANRLNPAWMRRRYFWQGVSDYAIYAYLKTKGIEPAHGVRVDMPFNRDNWTFVNDAAEPPTEEKLVRLRSLGFDLASSGFIPVN